MQFHEPLTEASESVGELQPNLVVEKVICIEHGIGIVTPVLVEDAGLRALHKPVGQTGLNVYILVIPDEASGTTSRGNVVRKGIAAVQS